MCIRDSHQMVQELREDLEGIQPRVEALRLKRMDYFLKGQAAQHRLAKELDPEKQEKLRTLCKFYRVKRCV